MIAGFELNEKLKEDLILDYGASYAKTEFFKNGIGLIHEPFLETIVRWDKGYDVEKMYEGFHFILKEARNINKVAEMTQPVLETSLGRLQIVWGIFDLEK